MDCPSCGSQVVDDQVFCRDCGAALTADTSSRRIPLAFWGMTLAFGGILIALTGSMIEVRAVVMIGVIISILGMFSIAAMSILSQGRRQAPRVARSKDSLPKADTTNKLPPMPAIDHFPSVTENTTTLLEHPKPQSSRPVS
ncbi:hypothetical protein BH10ACI2_BH10ACI2_18840 [soil metagenome]